MALFNFGRGLFLVTPSAELPPLFRAGERIPESGIYRVYHRGHRTTHECILLRGELFPRCSSCGAEVQFQQLACVPGVEQDSDHLSRKVFELPHPDPDVAPESGAA